MLVGPCMSPTIRRSGRSLPTTVRTIAGLAGAPGSADGIGSAARFFSPAGVAVDSSGTVYVADTGNHTIRKVMPGGVVITLAGSVGMVGSDDGSGSAARFESPQGIAVGSGGTVYVADTGNATIRKITAAGLVTTVAGAPHVNDTVDGVGVAARLFAPIGIAVDGAGIVYVAENLIVLRRPILTTIYGNTIRKITTDGAVTTLAGAPKWAAA